MVSRHVFGMWIGRWVREEENFPSKELPKLQGTTSSTTLPTNIHMLILCQLRTTSLRKMGREKRAFYYISPYRNVDHVHSCSFYPFKVYNDDSIRFLYFVFFVPFIWLFSLSLNSRIHMRKLMQFYLYRRYIGSDHFPLLQNIIYILRALFYWNIFMEVRLALLVVWCCRDFVICFHAIRTFHFNRCRIFMVEESNHPNRLRF